MTRIMTTAQVAELLIDHMSAHDLAEPASVQLTLSRFERHKARVQVHGIVLVDTARLLLAWMDTLSGTTLSLWRPSSGTHVHMNVDTTLSGPAGEITLALFGAASSDEAVFADLDLGQRRPFTLEQLTEWAAADGAEVAA